MFNGESNDISFKALSDGLCKTHWNVAMNFACVKCSELETSLSTAFYAANYTGLNESLPEVRSHKIQSNYRFRNRPVSFHT